MHDPPDPLPTISFVIGNMAVQLAGLSLTHVRAALLPALEKLAAIGVESLVVTQYKKDSPWFWLAFVYCDQTRQVLDTSDAAWLEPDTGSVLMQLPLLVESLNRLAENMVP